MLHVSQRISVTTQFYHLYFISSALITQLPILFLQLLEKLSWILSRERIYFKNKRSKANESFDGQVKNRNISDPRNCPTFVARIVEVQGFVYTRPHFAPLLYISEVWRAEPTPKATIIHPPRRLWLQLLHHFRSLKNGCDYQQILPPWTLSGHSRSITPTDV